MAEERTPFLSRWSQRKALVRDGVALPAEPPSESTLPPKPAQPLGQAPAGQSEAALAAATSSPVALAGGDPGEDPSVDPAPAIEPPPTLLEASQLTPASDFTRFVKSNVPPEVKNTALKQLFTDPHFNVMDRLDTYIDDYNTPDPLPASWLRKMTQSVALGLFDDEETETVAVAAAAPAAAITPTVTAPPLSPTDANAETAPHENTDLRLQQDHAAGQPGLDGGVGQDPGRQH